jgi:hypothetical protein
MKISEGQESDRSEDDGRSDDTLSRTMKCETHIDNHVYHYWTKVPNAFIVTSHDSNPFRKMLIRPGVLIGVDCVLRQ